MHLETDKVHVFFLFIRLQTGGEFRQKSPGRSAPVCPRGLCGGHVYGALC